MPLSSKLHSIKEKIKCSNEELENALLFISEQNFSPILDNDLGNENVIPDAIVKQKDNQWLILINDRFLNKYQISQDYFEAAMNSNSSKEEKTFLKNHISNAQNILDTLDYRSNVLKSVIEQILLVQGDYLIGKSNFLNPLKLEDIAKVIDKDISSVSRIIKNKFIDSPLGLISLKSLLGYELYCDPIYFKVLDHFRSQSAAGKALGLSQYTVRAWLTGELRISLEKASLLEEITKGKFHPSDFPHLVEG